MHTANKIQHVTAADAHDRWPHCHLMFPFYTTHVNTHINFILPKTTVTENYKAAAIVRVYLYLI